MYFRASTAERASELDLRGFAENQTDGSVLVLAAGSIASLDELVRWLHRGPPMARVDSVHANPIDFATVTWPAGFEQR